MLTTKEIMDIIPHRHPFLLVDKGKTAYFGAVNNARFKRKVVPGDKLKMECEIIKKKGPVGVGKAVATVDGEVALTAELTFMVG